MYGYARTHTHYIICTPALLYPRHYSLESPTNGRHFSSRDRSVSNDSFKMDPEAIERVTHPTSDQVYTVVNRSAAGVFKPAAANERTHKTTDSQGIKSYSSTPDVVERPSSSAAAERRRQQERASKRLSGSNVPAVVPVPRGRPGTPGRVIPDMGGVGIIGPRHPPPPVPSKRYAQQLWREPHDSTTDANNIDEHDYSDVPDEFSSPSPEPLSPVRQTSPPNPPPPTSSAPSAQSHRSKPPVAARRSREDVFSSNEPSKLKPGSKPAPRKKPGALAIAKGAGAGGVGGRTESQQPIAARDSSPFRNPLLPPTTGRPVSPQRIVLSQASPESPKQLQQQLSQQGQVNPPASNSKLRHRPSYTEVDPDQEIRVEPVPARASATDNDMWVKVKYNTGSRAPLQDSLGRKSTSSSNLTNTMTSASGSDCYSNLAELMINVTAPSTPGLSTQRRHSFTEGDEKMIIKASAANRYM